MARIRAPEGDIMRYLKIRGGWIWDVRRIYARIDKKFVGIGWTGRYKIKFEEKEYSKFVILDSELE